MTFKILVVFGTRPEAIKLAPLIRLLKDDHAFELKVCVTAQHRQMLDQVLAVFEINPDIDLNIMQQGQDLSDLTARMLSGLKQVLENYRPNCILVHGDTTTAFVSALAAFYQQIPIAHIEAGLRTHSLSAPFPEEANRRLTAVLAQWHFAPTEHAKQNLIAEGVPAHRIWVTGNTVIDTLSHTLHFLQQNRPLVERLALDYPKLAEHKPLLLVTCHRRENWGEGLATICSALAHLAETYPDTQIIYAVHRNPQVEQMVYARLSHISNLFLLPPQDYLHFVYLMQRASLIITDSGGIQEEAVAQNKSVLLLRECSERVEAVGQGTVTLVGTNPDRLIEAVKPYLSKSVRQADFRLFPSIYGDGKASERIIALLKQECFSL